MAAEEAGVKFQTIIDVAVNSASLDSSARTIEDSVAKRIESAGARGGRGLGRSIDAALRFIHAEGGPMATLPWSTFAPAAEPSKIAGAPAERALLAGVTSPEAQFANIPQDFVGRTVGSIIANIEKVSAEYLAATGVRATIAAQEDFDPGALKSAEKEVDRLAKTLSILQNTLEEVVTPFERAAEAARKKAQAEEDAAKRAAAARERERAQEDANRQRAVQVDRLAQSRRMGAEGLAFQRQFGLMTGNPFQVVSELVQQYTGIQKIQDDLANSFARLQEAQTKFAGTSTDNAVAMESAQKDLKAAEDEYAGAQKRAGSKQTKVKQIADFALTNIATSGLLFASFAAISTATNAIFEDLGKSIGYLLNPGKAAATTFRDLAASLSKVGGSEGLSKLIRLTEAQMQLAAAAEASMTGQEAVGAYGQTVAGQFAAERFGYSPEQAAVAGTAEGFKDLFLKSAGIDTIAKFGFTLQDTAKVLENLDAETRQRGQEAIDRAREENKPALWLSVANLLAGNFGQAIGGFTGIQIKEMISLDSVFKTVAESSALYASRQAASNQAMLNFENAANSAQQALFDLGLAAPMAKSVVLFGQNFTTDVQGAQQALTDAQTRLTKEQERVNRASAARQKQTQIEEARRRVGQAGVATAGDTVFDVAQRIINAQAELDKAKRSEQIQGNIEKYTKETAVATKALARERGWSALVESTPEMLKSIAKITDPKEQQKAREALRTLYLEFAGSDEIGRAAATIMGLISKYAIRNKSKPVGYEAK